MYFSWVLRRDDFELQPFLYVQTPKDQMAAFDDVVYLLNNRFVRVEQKDYCRHPW
jgi:hypothetical protein